MSDNKTSAPTEQAAPRPPKAPDGAVIAWVMMAVVILCLFLLVVFWFIEASRTDALARDRVAAAQAEEFELDGFQGNSLESRRFVLGEINLRLAWEQNHERTNRRYTTASAFAEWILAITILLLSTMYQQRSLSAAPLEQRHKSLFLTLLPFFAALALALPAITEKLAFGARQQLHDFRMQQLEFLSAELRAGDTTAGAAWDRMVRLYDKSPSSVGDFPDIWE